MACCSGRRVWSGTERDPTISERMKEAPRQSLGPASVNTRNGNNYNPIEVAVLWGNLAAVRLLAHRPGVDMKPGTEDNSL